MRPHVYVVMVVAILSSLSSAQKTHPNSRYGLVKAENGLVFGWQLKSEDSAQRQIDVYDGEGKLLVGLAPLRLVPEARRATVYDVSGLHGRFIWFSPGAGMPKI